MKIALIGKYGDGEIISGPERVARELYSELKNKNPQVIFIEYFFSGYNKSSVLKKLLGKEILPDEQRFRLGLIPLIIFLIKRKFDIIHIINSQRFVLSILLLNKFFKAKIVTTFHGFIKYELPVKKYWLKRYFLDVWVEKLSVKKSRLLIFPSTLLSNIFKEYYKAFDSNYVIIPNGVSRIFSKQNVFYPKIESSIKLVFYNGFNCSINRGLTELILLLEQVKISIELYIIGSEVQLKVSNKIYIEFVPPMDHYQLISFLKDKHFIIKGTAYDSFSIFVLEGMLCGVIPIVNEKIGVKDFINHEVNGFIYNSESQDDFLNLLNRIANGIYDLQKISSNANKIYDDLNWERIANKYLQAYQSIL